MMEIYVIFIVKRVKKAIVKIERHYTNEFLR